MPSALASFAAASLLAALDLGLLALAVNRLTRQPKALEAALLALAVALKLGLLVGGALWISRQPWYERQGLLLGLLAPFALFVAWQGLRLQLRHGQRKP